MIDHHQKDSPGVERTVVLLKPDAVKRGILGEVIARFEKTGLKIVAMKMVWVKEDMVKQHYPDDRIEFLRGMGEKTLKTYEEFGKDPQEELGTKDALTIGRMVNAWNIDFLSSGPVVALLLSGHNAISNVRQMAGNTLPSFAAPGTIRGDYSVDSPVLANARKRAVRNIIHASGSAQEAHYEEQLWFHENEIYSYSRAEEDIMF